MSLFWGQNARGRFVPGRSSKALTKEPEIEFRETGSAVLPAVKSPSGFQRRLASGFVLTTVMTCAKNEKSCHVTHPTCFPGISRVLRWTQIGTGRQSGLKIKSSILEESYPKFPPVSHLLWMYLELCFPGISQDWVEERAHRSQPPFTIAQQRLPTKEISQNYLLAS